jgi:hypothetical protein
MVATGSVVAVAGALSLSAPALAAPALSSSPFVARPGDLPGFSGARLTVSTASTPLVYVKFVLEENGAQARREVAKLKLEGFRKGVQERISGSPGEALSLTLVLGSHAKARRALKANLAEDVETQGNAEVERFNVPAIPGSAGFSAVQSGSSGAAANVLFVVGRCFLLVGDALNEGDATQARTAPVAGATKLAHRVKHVCA